MARSWQLTQRRPLAPTPCSRSWRRAPTAATFQALTAPAGEGGFGAAFAALFPDTDLLAQDNPITPADLPADTLLQFPFPLGDTWGFWGPHSWNGGNAPPPYSSMDFYTGGGTCDAPPGRYAVAAAAGSSVRRGSCWMEISHDLHWTTSYYHLQNLVGAGTQIRNGRLGSIACEICAGGFATGPHVHWSLKYDGAYTSLDGVKLSGWTIDVGSTPYDSGSLERAGAFKYPPTTILNDYHTYYPTDNTSLRFYGNGAGDVDRVKIPVDDPLNTYSGPPIDVGATDFTLEWWMKALPGYNPAPAVTCGANANWVFGNTLFDRDRFNQNGDYGVSLGGGRIVFGVTGADGSQRTLCGTTLARQRPVASRRSAAPRLGRLDVDLRRRHAGGRGARGRKVTSRIRTTPRRSASAAPAGHPPAPTIHTL